MAPIHWETDLREAYASLRGVKGSLRGGVLFGVAYAGGYGFFASRSEEVSFEATLFIVPEVASLPFILAFCASLPFILAFCGFIYFCGGPMAGALSCLRETYADVTRGELVASDTCIQMYSNSQLQGHRILQESQSLMFENII